MSDVTRRKQQIRSVPRVGSIATMPSRLGTFTEVLEAISGQLDLIHVFLDTFEAVPSFLLNNRKIIVSRSQEYGDFKAAGRYLVQERLPSPSVMVFLDDDIIYPCDYVVRLVDALGYFSGRAVVGVHGRNFIPPYESYVRDATCFPFSEALAKDTLVDELGSGTCAFLSDVMKFDVRNWTRFDATDILLATEAKLLGLPRICIARRSGWLAPYAQSQPDSLWLRKKRDPTRYASLIRILMSAKAAATPDEAEHAASLPPSASTVIADGSSACGSAGSDSSACADHGGTDVYLQPHSDDICFSLGGFALRSRRGVLLTVCPVSGYVPLEPGQMAPPAQAVTEMRISEDRAFARACGLDTQFLDNPCGSLLEYEPFDLARAEENMRRVAQSVMEALHSTAGGWTEGQRPWLFCPSGIGGHVDHVAVRMAIIQNYDELSKLYRVGFYEDLHYAADAEVRKLGIQRLRDAMGHRSIHRHVLPLDSFVAEKLDLVRLYPSQFLTLPLSIARFTPAAETAGAPHEAIWSEETPGPSLPCERLPQKQAPSIRAVKSRPSIHLTKLFASFSADRLNLVAPIRRGSKRHCLPGLLVVSLTSYSRRFQQLPLTIMSLLRQTTTPDRLILWISEAERHLLPDEVTNLQRYGLTIAYCPDIVSYKKLIPSLKVFPRAFIVTVDDDLYLYPNWLKDITAEYSGEPHMVICARAHAHRIVLDQGNQPAP